MCVDVCVCVCVLSQSICEFECSCFDLLKMVSFFYIIPLNATYMVLLNLRMG